jgi:thiamine pyrophosphokinase
MPNWIVGDFDSIRPEVQEYYNQKGVKLLLRADQDTTDLEKCLYLSLEKVSEKASDIDRTYNDDALSNKKFAIVLLGSSGGRIDHTFSTYSQVWKFLTAYPEQLRDTEVIMLSKSSCTVFLKPGQNDIIMPIDYDDKEEGYSVIPLFGEGRITVSEDENYEENVGKDNLIILVVAVKFGSNLFFRKKHEAKFVSVKIGEDKGMAFIFSFTCKYHDK